MDDEALTLKTNEIFNKIYDVLVESGGAPEHARDGFIFYHVGHHHPACNSSGMVSEWRFMGYFGMGGKLFCSVDLFNVSYYSEDETTVRRLTKLEIDRALKPLHAEWLKLWENFNWPNGRPA
jgi:hypothetical protein